MSLDIFVEYLLMILTFVVEDIFKDILDFWIILFISPLDLINFGYSTLVWFYILQRRNLFC